MFFGGSTCYSGRTSFQWGIHGLDESQKDLSSDIIQKELQLLESQDHPVVELER